MSVDPPASGSFPQAPPAPSLVGEILDGRYRVIKKLGEGGMGEVYAAEHIHIEKRFAVKLLKAEIVSNSEAVKRFQQEARSSSSIKHKNIIGVEDFGRLPDGRIYMCMELLDGQPLNDMIQQPMSADRLINILIQSGHGLAAAHAKGIVHRDMKPENIYVTHEGTNDVPKLLDFGIAKVAGNDGQNNLTRTGTIFGTPFYMAPEQALGNPVDQRTDIYAMGVIMYECFAGSLPFQGESFMGILTQHITTPPEPVAQRAGKAGRALPMGMAEIITKCMEKDPNARFQTMDELVNALIQVYRGIAGPGMSTYMEAFPVGSAAHMAQPTPPPMTGAHMAGSVVSGQSRTVASGTPPPYAPGQSQPVMPQQYGTGPHGAALSGQSGLYDPSSSVVVPKKSKTGLVIALIILLAAGGGIAAVVVLGKKDSGGGGGSGEVIAQNGSGSAEVETPPNGSGVVPENGSDTQNGSAETPLLGSNGSGDVANNGSDAMNGSDSGNQAGSDAPPLVVPGTKVRLVTQPFVESFEVYEKGQKVGTDADEFIVPKGETRTIVIKAKNFKDSKPTKINGKKKSVLIALSKIGGSSSHSGGNTGGNTGNTGNTGGNTGSNTGGNTGGNTTPPPTSLDCSDKMIDIKNAKCVRQFCAKHPENPGCDTE